MSKLWIGNAAETRRKIEISIPELLVTRLLIQANSGGGKSYLLRRILEQAFGKVQCFVIDVAGEFASLREKFGYVLVGEGGETPIDIRSAGLVAEKLLELRASAVFDLYSLRPPGDRHVWVKHFLAAMMNAPKKLWHPVIIAVDEAHKFMPEKGEGESVAKPEMLSLCSDGRKYGYCAILPTQRLAKLDKSGASELLNVLIGPTFIDVDLERAHKALGIVRKDWAAFDEQMKTVSPGYFWALGRAISKHRILVKVGDVQTTHPKPGQAHSMGPPPAPDKIKSFLPKLADLPKAAEEKACTEAEFKREIRELRAKVKAAEIAATKAAPAPVKVDPEKSRREIERAVNVATAPLVKQLDTLKKKVSSVTGKAVGQLIGIGNTLQAELKDIAKIEIPKIEIPKIAMPAAAIPSRQVPSRPYIAPPARAVHTLSNEASDESINGNLPALGDLHRQAAGILAGYYPEPVKSSVLAAMCGRTIGGSWSSRLSELRSHGLIEKVGSAWIKATEKCAREYAGAWERPQSTAEVVEIWKPKLSKVHQDMLNFLIEHDGDPVSRADLARAAKMVIGGSFSSRLSELRATGLIVEPGRSLVAANKETLLLSA